jgi:periplasmic divalent cation tolerance protein
MRVVLCNCAPAEARSLARALVAERLAACVNLLPAVRSYYFWEGELQEEEESTLLIKTAADSVAALRRRILQLHSYDTPEIVVLPVDLDASAEAYLRWVRGACRPDG